ncbi:MAG: FmdE family protein [Anaerolineae bacterium]
MPTLDELLERSAQLHRHLCPRQVLGVRMGLLAGEVLGLTVPQPDNTKRLYTIAETDGCAVDGISVATNCWVGRRTLRVEDYGKIAATFIDTRTGETIRITPRCHVRQEAHAYAPEARNKWEAMLLGYQRMPLLDLFQVQQVVLKTPIKDLISRPGIRAICEACGEEIINEREIVQEGHTLCRTCADLGYYDLHTSLEANTVAERPDALNAGHAHHRRRLHLGE